MIVYIKASNLEKMKAINNKDFNDFLKSHDIAKAVEKSLKEGENVLHEVITEDECSDEFLENITSSDYFQKQHDSLNEAYKRRDIRGFMNKLDAKKSFKRRRILILTFVSTSVAAAVLFFVFNILTPKSQKIEESIPVLAKNERPITVPTLIMQDSVIQLPENKIVAESEVIVPEIDQIENLRLVVPKGYTYTIQLSDSSVVTLNASSELIYPSQFSDGKREVELKGEAYFNVAKGASPFIIKAENTSIRVYGTQFNVNSYNKENIQTVLIHGSVGVSIEGVERMMKPNHMMTVNSKGECKLTQVEASNYISWMKGEIVNNNESLTNFLDKIGKWYGVEFLYTDDVKGVIISAEIKNSRPLDEIIKSIEIISNVKIIKLKNSQYMVGK